LEEDDDVETHQGTLDQEKPLINLFISENLNRAKSTIPVIKSWGLEKITKPEAVHIQA
jgi:hypothetical protein